MILMTGVQYSSRRGCCDARNAEASQANCSPTSMMEALVPVTSTVTSDSRNNMLILVPSEKKPEQVPPG